MAGRNLYGHGEISAFRAARSPVGLMRSTSRTVITSYGRDFAVASTLFHRDTAPGKVGRQMQSWVRFDEGWRIVAAHVSVIDEPGGRASEATLPEWHEPNAASRSAPGATARGP